MKPTANLLAVDTGGTFTDFYWISPKGIRVHKVPSTPTDPSLAIARGLEELGLIRLPLQLVHGSTVATNALLEKKGAKVLFLTTEGFEDVLEIGRQNREALYDLKVSRPEPLVPRRLRLGVSERLGPGGKVLRPLGPASIKKISAWVKKTKPASIAIGFLFSYARSIHEEKLARALGKFGIPLSLSSKICPEYREYERFSTTCVNAYVGPIMGRYLKNLQQRLRRPIQVMQSNGGHLSVPHASQEAVRTLLSGPAGGALGALQAARQAGFPKILCFDMGGTSTDLSLMDGKLELTSEAQVAGFPVKTPMIRIHTIGAGGGSIAWIDEGGALRMGPQSAGAQPGPICYGRGGKDITLTDAHVFLGRIAAQSFLGGRMRLYPERIASMMLKFSRRLGLKPKAAAEGMIRVANAAMERALRVLTVERGIDPRAFALLPFGGAGGLHACELAELLGMSRILVPRNPGILSAMGMAYSDWVRDYVQTVLLEAASGAFRTIHENLAAIKRRARKEAKSQGFAPSQIRFRAELDLRYRGQSYELRVPFNSAYARNFSSLHRQTYGFLHRATAVEIVNLRLQARVPSGYRLNSGLAEVSSGEIFPLEQKVYWTGGEIPVQVLPRAAILPGSKIVGPAIVPEFSATTFIASGWKAVADAWGNLILERRR